MMSHKAGPSKSATLLIIFSGGSKGPADLFCLMSSIKLMGD